MTTTQKLNEALKTLRLALGTPREADALHAMRLLTIDARLERQRGAR